MSGGIIFAIYTSGLTLVGQTEEIVFRTIVGKMKRGRIQNNDVRWRYQIEDVAEFAKRQEKDGMTMLDKQETIENIRYEDIYIYIMMLQSVS